MTFAFLFFIVVCGVAIQLAIIGTMIYWWPSIAGFFLKKWEEQYRSWKERDGLKP